MARRAEADVIVVGAGLAGLTAARQLHGTGHSVLVIEARDRVGGRVLSHSLGAGQAADVGGQFVGPTQRHILGLAAELGVATQPIFTSGLTILEFGGRRHSYRGVPLLSPLQLADSARAIAALERMARRVPPDAPWQAAGAAAADSRTLADWARRNVRTRLGRFAIEAFSRGVLACEPGEVSLLHVLFYLRSAGGFRQLTETSGAAQQDRFAGGSQLIAIRMAEQLGPGRVRLGAPVARIEQAPPRVTVHAAGLVATGRRAVIAVPPALAGRISYDPPLPADRDQLTQAAPMGSVIKCLAIYDEPFWRHAGYNGQATSDGPAAQVTFDTGPPAGPPGILLGFVTGAEARRSPGPTPRSGAPRFSAPSLAISAPPRPGQPTTSSTTGPPTSGPAAVTAPTSRRAPGHSSGPRCASRRPAALGRHRDRDALERLHGWRGPIRPARGQGGAGSTALTAAVTCAGLAAPGPIPSSCSGPAVIPSRLRC